MIGFRKVERKALADQVVAVIRNADGFPVSTGAIAKALGDRLVTFPQSAPPAKPRPPCWPQDVVDPERANDCWCSRCGGFHREPVWRSYQGSDILPLLRVLERQGEVERVVIDGVRNHYWRREDTDREVSGG